jgi:hypothetical protein
VNERENEGLDRASQEELERFLDEVAREERLEREEADRLKTAPGLARVERVLEETWARSVPRTQRPWRFRLTLFAVAAAAVVLAWFLFQRGGGPEAPREPEMLGDEEFGVLVPAAVVKAWPETIEWYSKEPTVYSLRVIDPRTGETIHGPVTTMDTKYAIPQGEVRTWPSKIRIQFEYRLPDGEAQPPLHHDAELRP